MVLHAVCSCGIVLRCGVVLSLLSCGCCAVLQDLHGWGDDERDVSAPFRGGREW
jgi:hypothetical protein